MAVLVAPRSRTGRRGAWPPAAAAAGLHGARRVRRRERVRAAAQRQARSRQTARTRRRPGLCGARQRARSAVDGHLAGSARPRADQHDRQFLRAGRQFAAGDEGRRAHPSRPACEAGNPQPVRTPHHFEPREAHRRYAADRLRAGDTAAGAGKLRAPRPRRGCGSRIASMRRKPAGRCPRRCCSRACWTWTRSCGRSAR